jgi:uncharacterized protein (TIGR02246 family)
MSTIVEEVLAAEARWNAVYLAKDVDAFAALLHPRFAYVSERGRFERDAYVGNLAAGIVDIRAMTTHDQQVRPFGDDVAIVTGVAELEATLEGRDISGTDDYTRVWVRDGQAGGWLAASQHASVRPG